MAKIPNTARVVRLRPDTIALLDRMEDPPSQAQRFNYNALMRDIANAGLDASIIGQLCLIGETEQQSLLPIIGNVALQPVNVNAMPFTTKQHYAGDGTTIQYIDTDYNPAVEGVAQNGHALGAYIRNNVQTANGFGVSDVVNLHGTILAPRNASNQAVVRVNAQANNNVASQTDARGLVAAHRSASNTITYYRNGVTPGGGSQNSTGVPSEKIAIGAIGRSPVVTVNAYQYAGWFIAKVALSANQHLALYRIFQRYLTNIGAAV